MKESKIEIYNQNVFENSVVDLIMKKENISENEAKEVLQGMYNYISLFDSLCIVDENTISLRQGIYQILKNKYGKIEI